MSPQAPDAEHLAALFALDGVKGFGPQKFKLIHESGVSPLHVLSDPNTLPVSGKVGAALRVAVLANAKELVAQGRRRAAKQLAVAAEHNVSILTYESPGYPPSVYRSNNPIPVLYVRGDVGLLSQTNAVACVGSRGIGSPYIELQAAFARAVCELGGCVVSGFAMGADTVAHSAAWKAGGKTICVMPSGLDRPFPPENRTLWNDLLGYQGAAFVSEFPLGTAASALTLRKRNKLIVSFAKAVLVAQSATDGGAMNAYRFALEQRKPVVTFASDGTDATSGNREIAANPRAGGTAFSNKAPEPELYVQWLRALFSLI